jgi:hypothetical protein
MVTETERYVLEFPNKIVRHSEQTRPLAARRDCSINVPESQDI